MPPHYITEPSAAASDFAADSPYHSSVTTVKMEEVVEPFGGLAMQNHSALYPQLDNLPADIYRKTRDIADLPVVRPIDHLALRPGKHLHLSPETSNILRYYKAALAHQRGALQNEFCTRCTGGKNGPFQACVVLDGFGQGACTNCAYFSSNSKCSLFKEPEDTLDGEDTWSELDPVSPRGDRQKRKAAVNAEQRFSSFDSHEIAGQNTDNRGILLSHSGQKSIRPTEEGAGHGQTRSSQTLAQDGSFKSVNATTFDAITPHGKSPNSIFATQAQEDFFFIERRKDPTRPDISRARTLADISGISQKQIKAWFDNQSRPQRAEVSHVREQKRLEWLDKNSSETAILGLLREGQFSNSYDSSADVRGQSSDVVSETKTCRSCGQTKHVSQYREYNKYDDPGYPKSRKSNCIPCDDRLRLAREEKVSKLAASRMTASAMSNLFSRQELDVSRNDLAPSGGGHTPISFGHMRQENIMQNANASEDSIVYQPAAYIQQEQEQEQEQQEQPHSGRVRLTAQQWDVLNEEHNKNPHPTRERKELLAAEIGCKRESVSKWFTKRNKPGNPGGWRRPRDESATPSNHLGRIASGKRQRRHTLENTDDSDNEEPIPNRRKTIHVTSTGRSSISHQAASNPNSSLPGRAAIEKRQVEAPAVHTKPPQSKPSRTPRYLQVYAEIEEMSSDEKRLELADLQFKTYVLSNCLAKVTPMTRSSGYQKQEAEFLEMSEVEQQLQNASLKFRLSVVQDAIAEASVL